MTTYAEWRSKTDLFDKYLPTGYHAMADLVAQSAYKAGERHGRSQVEKLARNAETLRAAMDNHLGQMTHLVLATGNSQNYQRRLNHECVL